MAIAEEALSFIINLPIVASRHGPGMTMDNQPAQQAQTEYRFRR
ncbi:hypothetical protein [Novosphingobium mangrovi (ex Huang et al. 2023)]|uniref:Transposase n=1 Tax=Novosphingobium mangrovi (ex Huang et al. 2023) TaxID=2976432 RepID=A0ABT2I7D3_9SPHN|nr:hypothetical protein [Novosphingobium mangrovi (ex Huang et al. 2023)]MCT2400724.1 hypothetical protein [Novosphingobium mangrovi (ex Huang et al. 2023)]